MPLSVSVRSFADLRGGSGPLFPVYCGDNGAVCATATDAYIRVPGAPDTSNYQAYGVARQFLRLGPRSRKLVMSLYRAIVERFYIMRATGGEATRPAKPNFCFGAILTACNCDCNKKDFAGRNRRRAFGGFFRYAFQLLRDYAYPCRATVTVDCGPVRFFPFTPYVCNVSPSRSQFVPGAQEYWTVTGQPFAWDSPNVTWSRFICNGDTKPWLWDVGDRSLTRAFAAAYSDAGYSDAACFTRFADCRHGVPVRRLESYHACACNGCGLPNAGSVDEVMDTYFSGNLPPSFNLPALLTALRIFSAWNAQSVAFNSPLAIPHSYVYASRRVVFSSSGNTIRFEPDADVFTQCTRYCSGLSVCALKTYQTGGASLGDGWVWYRLSDRLPCVADMPPGASIIQPSCWERWTSQIRRNAGTHSEAMATYLTLKPVASARVTFGAIYPADWASSEGDLFYSAVSTFASDSCGNRAWVALQNGSAGDAADNLASQIVDMARRRICADFLASGFSGGDTFQGMSFPAAQAAVLNEFLDPDSPDLAELQAAVDETNRIGNIVENSYCYIEALNCGGPVQYYGVKDGLAESVCIDYLGTGDKWMKLGRVNGASITFGYDRHTDPNCGQSTIARTPFRGSRRIVFGGFFGTYVFNNRAARQVP